MRAVAEEMEIEKPLRLPCLCSFALGLMLTVRSQALQAQVQDIEPPCGYKTAASITYEVVS